jgi:hypothetical protein
MDYVHIKVNPLSPCVTQSSRNPIMTNIATAPTTEPERWLSLTAAARWIGCSREHALTQIIHAPAVG